MKNLAIVSIVLFLVMLIMAGCEKKDVELKELEAAHKGELVAAKTNLRISDMDTLIVVGADNDAVTWTVTPAGTDTLIKKNNKLIVRFGAKGTYTISASVNGGTPLSIDINVDWYVPIYITKPFTDENIVITPRYYKSSTSDSTYFTLSAQINNIQTCANSFIEVSQSKVDNNFSISFNDIKIPVGKDCALPNSQLPTKMFYFYNEPTQPYSFGTSYPLSITVGTTTYNGTVTLNPTYMDISWNYSSGVTMSSKHITF